MPGGLTRRLFLEIVGQAGGGAALYSATQALGLQEAVAPPPFAPVGRAPAGARVLVLGAGIAGLTAAYELQKLGYECEVIEARTRAGGRACTVRRGTASEEVAPTGGQLCQFDEGQYFNPGPMRIPNTHVTTLAYCRELRVPLEMFTTVNEAAYVHQKNGADAATSKMRLRELHADWRGITSEMLAKVVAQDSLDRRSAQRTRLGSSTGCASKAIWTPTCATAAHRDGAIASCQPRARRPASRAIRSRSHSCCARCIPAR